jgi:hypothetical protein
MIGRVRASSAPSGNRVDKRRTFLEEIPGERLRSRGGDARLYRRHPGRAPTDVFPYPLTPPQRQG